MVLFNLTPTEVTLKDTSMWKMLKAFINKPVTTTPAAPLPSNKTNLDILQDDTPVIIWFGHSSYLIQCKGFRILVDPVFSGNASPVSFFGKAFPGSDIYSAEDFGAIDIVIITHDHYDHLDYKTILALKDKAKLFCTSLGVGAHLEYWGVDAAKIVEFDWWQSALISADVELTATPARHFSGRKFNRGQTLWSSFVLSFFNYTIFIGADSGYENHFKSIADKFAPFDMVIMETGQYGDKWPYIHTTPEDAVKAAVQLQTKMLLPVHWAKFALALHPWTEPIERVLHAAQINNLPVTTPMIGEPIVMDKSYPNTHWWTLKEL